MKQPAARVMENLAMLGDRPGQQYDIFTAYLARKKDRKKKLELLEAGLAVFVSTRYQAMIQRTREMLMAVDYRKLLVQCKKQRGEARLDALERALPEFEGTRYQHLIQKMIE